MWSLKFFLRCYPHSGHHETKYGPCSTAANGVPGIHIDTMFWLHVLSTQVDYYRSVFHCLFLRDASFFTTSTFTLLHESVWELPARKRVSDEDEETQPGVTHRKWNQCICQSALIFSSRAVIPKCKKKKRKKNPMCTKTKHFCSNFSSFRSI